MSHGIKWIECRDDNWKKCQHLKVPNSLDSGVPHMFRIISHKSWWSWMVNFSPSAKWLQHLRQESRRKLLEFLDLHPKWNPATKTQQKRSSSKQSLKSKMHQKTLTWSPKAMTSIFEGRKLCLFQPKQGSFGFQAYILCICIYIPNLAVRWFKETTKRSWPDDLKKEKVHENLHRLPWVHDPSSRGWIKLPTQTMHY